jgi:hypothetical protein
MTRFEVILQRTKKRVKLNQQEWEDLESDFGAGMSKTYIMSVYSLSSIDFKVLKEYYNGTIGR